MSLKYQFDQIFAFFASMYLVTCPNNQSDQGKMFFFVQPYFAQLNLHVPEVPKDS